MNESSIQLAKSKLEEASSLLITLVKTANDLVEQEKSVDREREIVRQKISALNTEKSELQQERANILKEKNYIVSANLDIKNKADLMSKAESKIEESREKLREEDLLLNEKIKRYNNLDTRYKELLELEATLNKQQQEVLQQVTLHQKQVLIDRERKESLDIREMQLNKEKERVKKFLEISKQ